MVEKIMLFIGIILVWWGFVETAVGFASHNLKPRLKWIIPIFILSLISWKLGINS